MEIMKSTPESVAPQSGCDFDMISSPASLREINVNIYRNIGVDEERVEVEEDGELE